MSRGTGHAPSTAAGPNAFQKASISLDTQYNSNTRHDSSSTMSRRSAIRAFAGAGVVLVTISQIGQVAAEHTSKQYTVTANANFRTGPSTGYAIISVITKGTKFTLNGQTKNGYAGITHGGRSGWVLASLVIEAAAVAVPVITGTAWTTARVNLRSGPGTASKVLRVVPSGVEIGTSTTENNGFLYVSYQGQGGWMSRAYISASNPDDQGGNYRKATANLNLRAEPSTSAKVLKVIPAGAKVQLLHTQVGQFGNVNYGGYQGWAALAYLK